LKINLFATALAISAAALSGATAQTPPADSGLLANPAYVKNCAKCHGKTAEGRHFGGPALILPKTTAASAENLRNIIANGKGRMPKFAGKLTPDEIDTLAKQIQTLKK
jgi:mono/diheme cytochrome c family protein